MAKKVVTMLSNQTVYDLALQLYGSVDQVFTLLDDNDNLTNVHSTAVGQDVEYEEQTLGLTNHYRDNNINLVSGFPLFGEENPSNWILANNFWNDGGVWIDTETWND